MTMTSVRNITAAAMLVLGAVALAVSATASTTDDAAAFINTLADRAIDSLTAKDVSNEERVQRFRKMFNDNFAVESIGKRVLGRYWRRASAEEQKEYLRLFEDYIIASYSERFASYAGEKLEIIKAVPESGNSATVLSEIKLPDGGDKPVRVDWLVESTNGSFKIVDLAIEGVSMTTTLNSDFGSIVRNNGGRISALLDVLKEKTAALTAK